MSKLSACRLRSNLNTETHKSHRNIKFFNVACEAGGRGRVADPDK